MGDKDMGRPPLKGERMSKAEYQRRYREKKKRERQEIYFAAAPETIQEFNELAALHNKSRNELIGSVLHGALVALRNIETVASQMTEQDAELFRHKGLLLLAHGQPMTSALASALQSPELSEEDEALVMDLINNRHNASPEDRKVLEDAARIIANSDKLKERLK